MIEFVSIYPREFGVILKHMNLIYSFFEVESESRVMAESSRFRTPKSTEQERSMLIDSIPKNTRQKRKWAVKVFEDWQHTKKNKAAIKENVGFGQMGLATIQPVKCRVEDMSAETLNFWLTKFTKEVTSQSGGRYPLKTLYLHICGLNRYLANGKHDNNFNVLEKADRR